MATPGNIIRFTTTPEGADQFASLLERLLEPVNAEEGTTVWFAGRAEDDPTKFFIVDLFADVDGRNVHFSGAAAELLRAEAPSLLAGAPEISLISTLATKNVGLVRAGSESAPGP